MNSLVFSFSEAYRKEGFLQWLQKEADAVRYLDFHALEGCCCYCDENAQEAIEKALEGPLPLLRWLDSGDYHYLSYLLAKGSRSPSTWSFWTTIRTTRRLPSGRCFPAEAG